jgi:hypothetical protein
MLCRSRNEPLSRQVTRRMQCTSVTYTQHSLATTSKAAGHTADSHPRQREMYSLQPETGPPHEARRHIGSRKAYIPEGVHATASAIRRLAVRIVLSSPEQGGLRVTTHVLWTMEHGSREREMLFFRTHTLPPPQCTFHGSRSSHPDTSSSRAGPAQLPFKLNSI